MIFWQPVLTARKLFYLITHNTGVPGLASVVTYGLVHMSNLLAT